MAHNNKRVGPAVLLAAFAALGASAAHASLLAPGGSVLTSAGSAPVGATLVVPALNMSITTATYTGHLVSYVYSGDTSNALGGLTFVYQLFNDNTSANDLHRLAVNGFAGFQTDVSYKLPGVGSTDATRDSGGGVVGFDFTTLPVIGNGAITPGSNSAFVVIQTNAAGYAPTTASVIDGTVTTTSSYAPSAAAGAIPEPTSLALLGVSSLGLMLRRRRSV